MNASAFTETVRDFRRGNTVRRGNTGNSTAASAEDDDREEVHGAFKIEVAYAENIKPANNSGLANAYVTIRVPEGTMSAGSADITTNLVELPTSSVAQAEKASVLNGKDCEMARTRVIYDTINPSWDEVFTILLPPVTRLELSIHSKNLISSDQLCGRATIELHRGTRLRRKLMDHQTHDVYVATEPQGQILLRMTLEGEEENIDFWFLRSKEKLNRTKDDFIRAICSKVYFFVFLLLLFLLTCGVVDDSICKRCDYEIIEAQ
jgi:hypothetical protein